MQGGPQMSLPARFFSRRKKKGLAPIAKATSVSSINVARAHDGTSLYIYTTYLGDYLLYLRYYYLLLEDYPMHYDFRSSTTSMQWQPFHHRIVAHATSTAPTCSVRRCRKSPCVRVFSSESSCCCRHQGHGILRRPGGLAKSIGHLVDRAARVPDRWVLATK
jgi:hypothetical protein